MSFKLVIYPLGKLLLCGLVFLIGTILGGMAAGLLGIPAPAMPANIDPAKVAQSIPLVGILMAAVLAVFSKQSGVGFLLRWMILGLFSWTVYGLNNYLEARFFSPDMATSYLLVFNFVACFTVSAAVAWLFKPTPPVETFQSKARAFFAARPVGSWTWRFLAGVAAFPIAYFVFGWLISPFVVSYYEQQYAGLALPKLDVMLQLSLLRSLLFLLCILPLLIAWRGGRLDLFIALGTGLFAFVGGLNMLQAIWLPDMLRTAHSLEILADSFAHAAVLVFILVPGSQSTSKIQALTNEMAHR